MDHSYIDIEAHIREARRQRSEALGKLISTGWTSFKRLLTGLQYGRAPINAVGVNSSPFIGFHYLP